MKVRSRPSGRVVGVAAATLCWSAGPAALAGDTGGDVIVSDEGSGGAERAVVADARAVERARAELERTRRAPGRLIVVFEPAAGPVQRSAALEAAGVRLGRAFRTLGDVALVEPMGDEAAALAALRDRPGVIRSAEPDALRFPGGSARASSTRDGAVGVPIGQSAAETVDAFDDPLLPDQWALDNTGQFVGGVSGTPGVDIDAHGAWDRFVQLPAAERAAVLVAVIDSGIDVNHPDLAPAVWVNPGEIPGNNIDDDGNGYIDDVRGWDFYDGDADVVSAERHGTHVAGIVAASAGNGAGIAGAAPGVSVLPLRFIGPGGGATSDAIAALEYAVAAGARVSNNSWGGGPYSAALEAAIGAAGAAGHVFVAAAGNDGAPQAAYPARYPAENILSVAAHDADAALAPFSQYHPDTVDLAAPGVNILSTWSDGGYALDSGTSMAAPMVSATVAMLAAIAPEWSAAELAEHVRSSAVPEPGLSATSATGGRLDAGAALAAVYRAPLLEVLEPTPGDAVEPGGPIAVVVRLDPRDDRSAGAPVVYWSRSADAGAFPAGAGAGGETWNAATLEPAGDPTGTLYMGRIGPAFCGESVVFYVSASGLRAGELVWPAEGADAPARTAVGTHQLLMHETFETGAPGWSTSWTGDDAASGTWAVGVPEPTDAQPAGAAQGERCAATGPLAGDRLGAHDVDDGRTSLVSPPLDPAGSLAAELAYSRWFSNNTGAAPDEDVLLVQASDDDGATWVTVEAVGPTGAEATGGWRSASVRLDHAVALTNSLRVRFLAEDAGLGSVVEAAVDSVRVRTLDCDGPWMAGDFDADGSVGVGDFFILAGSFGASDATWAAGDANADGGVDIDDFFLLATNWGR